MSVSSSGLEKEERREGALFLSSILRPPREPQPPARSIGQVARPAAPGPPSGQRRRGNQLLWLAASEGERAGERGGRVRRWWTRGAITSYLLRNHYGLPNGHRSLSLYLGLSYVMSAKGRD